MSKTANPKDHAVRALARLLDLRDEITERITERDVLVRAAIQHGARTIDVAAASGLSTSQVTRMSK